MLFGFDIKENCIDHVEVDALLIDVCDIVLDGPYMYMRDAI